MNIEEIPAEAPTQKSTTSLLVTAKANKQLLSLVALVGIIAGTFGGAFGSASLYKSASVQKLAGNPAISQNIILSEDSAVIDVVKRASPAVVSIVVSKDVSRQQGFGFNPFLSPFYPFNEPNLAPTEPNIQEVGAGSGFFVSSDGLILTNRHVVEDQQASYTVVTSDGKSYEATILARDPVNDLAIVKVSISGAPKLELANSSDLQIGQRVIAIGNSLGHYQNTVTTGVISGIGRSITAGSSQGSEQLEGVIQTDAAINPGNSGGPLLNSSGQVVGINTAVDLQGQLVGFAIPSNDANKALSSFQKSGRIVRPQLGIRHIIITPELASEQQLGRDHGALVIASGQNSGVIPGSAADKAGIVEGDIILEINGQRIDEKYTLVRALKNYQAGDTVTFKVFHAGVEKDIQVTLGEAK